MRCSACNVSRHLPKFAKSLFDRKRTFSPDGLDIERNGLESTGVQVGEQAAEAIALLVGWWRRVLLAEGTSRGV